MELFVLNSYSSSLNTQNCKMRAMAQSTMNFFFNPSRGLRQNTPNMVAWGLRATFMAITHISKLPLQRHYSCLGLLSFAKWMMFYASVIRALGQHTTKTFILMLFCTSFVATGNVYSYVCAQRTFLGLAMFVFVWMWFVRFSWEMDKEETRNDQISCVLFGLDSRV